MDARPAVRPTQIVMDFHTSLLHRGGPLRRTPCPFQLHHSHAHTVTQWAALPLASLCLPTSHDHRGGPLHRRPCLCDDYAAPWQSHEQHHHRSQDWCINRSSIAALMTCTLSTSPSQSPSTALGGRGDGHQNHHSGKLGSDNTSALTSLQPP